MSPRIRVLVVDDNVDLARALHMSFEDHPTIESTGWIDATDGILEAVRLRSPHVLLVDLTMPGDLQPLEAIRRLRATGTVVKVIAYSGYDDPRTIDDARLAGADAFVSKRVEPESIVEAVHEVMRGRSV